MTIPKALTSAALGAALTVTFSPAVAQTDSDSLTVYFTRHAEKQTVTIDISEMAGDAYTYTTNSDGSYVHIGNDNEKGTRLDEVCGEGKCAEELSDLGEARAQLLADWFYNRDITNKLDAVYATHKMRTQQTVIPTAVAADLDVIQLPATLEGETATELNPESTTPSECAMLEAIAAAQEAGMDTILLSGHSGTLYDIMGYGNDFCNGLGLDTSDDDRFPKDEKGKVRDYGDIWKVVINPNGIARFAYRKNLQPTKLSVVNQSN